MEELPEVVRLDDDDALALVDAERLSEDEALYARAARAANTVRGYRSDWREWQRAGVWERLHQVVLDGLGRQGLLDWSRACLDGVSVRAKRGVS